MGYESMNVMSFIGVTTLPMTLDHGWHPSLAKQWAYEKVPIHVGGVKGPT